MGKTRDVFTKIKDTKGTLHAKMGTIKDRNGMDLIEAEDIRRGGKNTQKLYKSSKMMLLKCCTQYANKFGKLSSGHRTGKGQFLFQSQRKAMPKDVQVQFSSITQSCPNLCNPMDCNTPCFPVHHQHPELAQTHVYQVGGAIQPFHPLSSPSPPAFNLSQLGKNVQTTT